MGLAEMSRRVGALPVRSVPHERAGRPPWADGRFIDVPAIGFPASDGGFDGRASQTSLNHGDRYDAPNRAGDGRAELACDRVGIGAGRSSLR